MAAQTNSPAPRGCYKRRSLSWGEWYHCLHRPPPMALQWQWQHGLQVTWRSGPIWCPMVTSMTELGSKYLITQLILARQQKRMNQPWRYWSGDTHAAREFACSICSFRGLAHCKLGKYPTAVWNWGVHLSFSQWQIDLLEVLCKRKDIFPFQLRFDLGSGAVRQKSSLLSHTLDRN